MRYGPRDSNPEAMTQTEKRDIIPGTDIIFADRGDAENEAPDDVVLIPQPTSSPDDPLVSSASKKL